MTSESTNETSADKENAERPNEFDALINEILSNLENQMKDLKDEAKKLMEKFQSKTSE